MRAPIDTNDDAVCGAQEESPSQHAYMNQHPSDGEETGPENVSDSVPRIDFDALGEAQRWTEQHHDRVDQPTSELPLNGSEIGREMKDTRQESTQDETALRSAPVAATEQGEQPSQRHPPPQPRRSSLEELEHWAEAWVADSTSGASQIGLPRSSSTSVATFPTSKSSNVNALNSLEQLQLRPEAVPLPKRSKKKQDFSSENQEDPLIKPWGASGGAWKTTRKREQKADVLPPPAATMAETDVYRSKIDHLAAHLINFENVATTETRHGWSPRLVYYDCLDPGQDPNPRRYEPWESRSAAPSFEEFYGTLRNVSDDCDQRVVLVEDLTPSLIDLLGATFQIPPHVFEEHLDRSGYRKSIEGGNGLAAWRALSSDQSSSSVTWYRPVLSLFPTTTRLRSKLIRDRKPRVRCPFDGCQDRDHNVQLKTESNIWRRQLDLCPEPGVYHKGSETEYPVGWEERATLWMREYGDCKFVILLLDPLPIVSIYENINNERKEAQRPAPTLAGLWPRAEARRTRSRGFRPHAPLHANNAQAWVSSLPGNLVPPAEPHLLSQSRVAQSTDGAPQQIASDAPGVQKDIAEDDAPPAALRRRATRPDMDNGSITSIEAAVDMQGNSRHQSVALTATQPPNQDNDRHSASADIHGPFVPYSPLTVRSSPSAWDEDNLQMRAYLESLQIPRSTIDEFEHLFTQPSKGKEAVQDPLRALFRAIHDDTHSLVDIIRVSLQRIREGTLDEGLMQKRVGFWRVLVHSLNFHVEELEQRLGAFVHFAYDTQQHSTPSETLARDTRQTLRACMELIDRSSRSLLAEMQIVDSRRSIAEAESVSKLTELAFVFIPLSFVASLFSMQVHELDGGVPVYMFALVAIGFVFIAYAVRLSIRSSRLIAHKNKLMQRMRDESQLQHNDHIPTHTFLLWAGRALGTSASKSARETVSLATPFVLVFAALAAMLSPIVLLWLRDINKGFSAVITVIMLLLDAVLVLPVVWIDGVEAAIRGIKRNYVINRTLRAKRKKMKEKKKQNANGLDLEVGDEDSSSEDDVADDVDAG